MQLAMRVAVPTGAREWADIQMGWRAKRNGTSFTSNQTTGDARASAECELFQQLRSVHTQLYLDYMIVDAIFELSQRIRGYGINQ